MNTSWHDAAMMAIGVAVALAVASWWQVVLLALGVAVAAVVVMAAGFALWIAVGAARIRARYRRLLVSRHDT